MARKRKNAKTPSAFGEKVSELREQMGLTMTELALRTTVSEAYISMLEAGGRHPSKKMVKKLAEVLYLEPSPILMDQLLVLADYPPQHHSGKQAGGTRYQSLLSKKNPENFYTFMALVNSLIKQGQYTLAQDRIKEGFKIFQNKIQMQMLVAFLELTQKKYDLAIEAMESALQAYHEGAADSALLSEIFLNTGVLYFAKGTHLLGQSHEAKGKAASQLSVSALQLFELALGCFQNGLKEDGFHIQLLDESARVSFNIADLLSKTKAKPYWKKTIAFFKLVLASEYKHELGAEALQETGCFLAHAYSKSGLWEPARDTLHLVTAFQPKYWFAHYVLSCHYALFYEKEPTQEVLNLSLKSLKNAGELFKGAFQQALLEPDLDALKEHRWDEVQGLMGS